LPSSQAWQEVNRAGRSTQTMLEKVQDVCEELSWLEFVMYAPEHP
jgi:hypothetical protein